MELKCIEAFLMVVEKGSFSIAAEALYITQPSLSSRIRHLEQELGITLFERSGGKKAILTDTGKQILPYFKEGFSLITKGLELKTTSVAKQKYVFSCPNLMNQQYLSTILEVLYKKFPNISFELKTLTSFEIINALKNGEVDIGLVFRNRVIESEITSVLILEDQTILVSAYNHPLAKNSCISIRDLENVRTFIYDKDFSTNVKIARFLKENGLKGDNTIEINNIDWLKMMVKHGLGIAFLQQSIIKDDLESKQLRKLDFNQHLPTTPISLLFTKNVPNKLKPLIIETAKNLLQS